MIYEYRVYEAAPGKLEALNSRFRNHTLGIFERHGIKNIGYWTSAVGDYSDQADLHHRVRGRRPSRARLGGIQGRRGVEPREGGVRSRWGS